MNNLLYHLKSACVFVKHIILFMIPPTAVAVADNIVPHQETMSRAIEQSVVIRNYFAAASYVVGLVCAIVVAHYKVQKNRRKPRGE